MGRGRLGTESEALGLLFFLLVRALYGLAFLLLIDLFGYRGYVEPRCDAKPRPCGLGVSFLVIFGHTETSRVLVKVWFEPLARVILCGSIPWVTAVSRVPLIAEFDHWVKLCI